MFQGTPIGAGVLHDGAARRRTRTSINFSESAVQLGRRRVSLYQHLGAGLGGGDYFAVNSQFTSDNPGGGVTRDPSAGVRRDRAR